ncbi:MAG: hypothetical protein KBG48_10530 [Kofleriaceae bacterium]|nr:hypothetical protein [Kofleriaceae bacterium]MBP9167816.1 hypothetical protein [Kofleriaceae bacterium]MBP9863445.1 hypothetical protein [Kofleriaceae bacterium]
MSALPGGDQFTEEMQVYAVAKKLEDTVRLHEIPGLPLTGALPVDTVIALIERLTVILRSDRGTLSNHTAYQVEMAVFAAARAGRDADDGDAAVLNALGANLAHAATTRGVALASDLPDSNMITTSGDDQARMDTAALAIERETRNLLADLSALDDPSEMEERIAHAVPRLRALMRTRTRRPSSKDISRHLDSRRSLFHDLHTFGRDHHLDLAASHLDELFDAEDHFLTTHSLSAANHKAKYYGDRTAAQLDDDPTNDDDDSQMTGGALIEQIVAHYQGRAMQQHLALTSVAEMLKEPPPPRDVSAFERVLSDVAKLGMSAIANHLSSIFSSAVRAIAARPVATAAAAGAMATDAGSALSDGADAMVSQLPRPVARGVRATGRAVGRGAKRAGRAATKGVRAVGAQFDVAPEVVQQLTAVGQQILSYTHSKDDEIKLFAPATKAVVGAVGAARPSAVQGTIVPTFVSAMAERIAAYADSITSGLPVLRDQLQLLPPAALQAFLEQIAAAQPGVQAALRVDLAQRWTTAIAAAHHGLEDDGTVASPAGVEFGDVKHRPGVVTLKLHVAVGRGPFGSQMPRPIVTEPPRITGLGGSLLAELRRAKIPLLDAEVHREIEITFTDRESGATLRAGLVQLSPDGAIDFGHNTDLFDLASLGRGEVPDSDHENLVHTVADGLGQTNPADATRAVRELLAATGLHTGVLTHDENGQ